MAGNAGESGGWADMRSFRGGVSAPGTAGPARIRLVAVDLDGVVWLGGTVLPDAPRALADVVERGLDLRYVSNNSTAHREAVSERLAAAGLPAGAGRVLTSGFVTARWLRDRLPEGAPVLVVGESGLLQELAEVGLAPIRAGNEPAAPAGAPYRAVVVGMDRSFDFKALTRAQAALIAGALFVGTNPDPTFPTPTGLLPGAGSVVAAVATAAQREPVFMGKPGLGLAEVLATETGVPAEETLFIGDRLSTDIGMGCRAGMVTALVLTGVTSPADLDRARADGSDALPDHVLSTLADLPPLLDSLGAPL
jgi:phosphoglycolate/pyridoxal phosphate phosphatase family enzyme